MLKSLLILLLLSSSFAQADFLSDKLQIGDHMRQIYNLRDRLTSQLETPGKEVENADLLRSMREHFHTVFGKMPPRHTNKMDSEKRLEHLNFQKWILRAMRTTVDLETVILTPASTDEEKERRQSRIRDLVYELSIIEGRAHGKHKN